MNRGAVAELDRSALRSNLGLLRRVAAGKEIIAVVKADAYGHGAVEAARLLQEDGVRTLAVAFSGEARLLREAGIATDILVLFDRSDPADFFELKLSPVLHDLETARLFSGESRKQGVPLKVHVKVDTGMGRLGLPGPRHSDILEIAALPGLTVTGLMSHFSEADLADRNFAQEQIREFRSALQLLRGSAGGAPQCHFANSAAIFSLPDAHFDAVRPGIALYGYSPAPDSGLRPVMKVRTTVLAVREIEEGRPLSYGRTFVTHRRSRIAVIPTGYADGYNRLFSNRAEVLVRGERAPVVGRVCMDITLADVTGIPEVLAGDEVVLLGSQGQETITAEELAGWAGTIPYEILTSLGSRARRVWTEGRTG